MSKVFPRLNMSNVEIEVTVTNSVHEKLLALYDSTKFLPDHQHSNGDWRIHITPAFEESVRLNSKKGESFNDALERLLDEGRVG